MNAYIVKDGVLGERLASVRVSLDLHERDYIEFPEYLDTERAIAPHSKKSPQDTYNVIVVPVIDLVSGRGAWNRERVLAFDSKEQRSRIR